MPQVSDTALAKVCDSMDQYSLTYFYICESINSGINTGIRSYVFKMVPGLLCGRQLAVIVGPAWAEFLMITRVHHKVLI